MLPEKVSQAGAGIFSVMLEIVGCVYVDIEVFVDGLEMDSLEVEKVPWFEGVEYASALVGRDSGNCEMRAT